MRQPQGSSLRHWFINGGGVAVTVGAIFGLRWVALRDENKPADRWLEPSMVSGEVLKNPSSRQGDRREGAVERATNGISNLPAEARAGSQEPAAVFGVLADNTQTVDERVQRLRSLRGRGLSEEEHLAALAFLEGKNVPAGMGKGSVHWLADELMTVMRLQVPPQDSLAAELGEIAFRPETDPVVRDYIMQHLGHLWEQFGAREIIEKSLWRAVACSDQTTPGSALIALSRGYERDQQPENLKKVRAQALALLKDPATGLAVRVTALAIAGDGASQEVKALARELAQNAETPLILKRVAERIAGKWYEPRTWVTS
jgi:hypothetical protein